MVSPPRGHPTAAGSPLQARAAAASSWSMQMGGADTGSATEDPQLVARRAPNRVPWCGRDPRHGRRWPQRSLHPPRPPGNVRHRMGQRLAPGQPGEQGPPGQPGSSEAFNVRGSTVEITSDAFTEILRRDVPAGSYVVTASVEAFTRSQTTGPRFISCMIMDLSIRTPGARRRDGDATGSVEWCGRPSAGRSGGGAVRRHAAHHMRGQSLLRGGQRRHRRSHGRDPRRGLAYELSESAQLEKPGSESTAGATPRDQRVVSAICRSACTACRSGPASARAGR